MEDKRILIISRIGCPPPESGNRARMASFLREIRNWGYQIHFAGVRLPIEEKQNTLPQVDAWVADFVNPPPLKGWSRIFTSLKYRFRRLLGILRLRREGLDDFFCEHWLAEARALQLRQHYERVLVPYVFDSKFLEAFPDSCLKIIDVHDCFSRPKPKSKHAKTEGFQRSYTPAEERRGLLRAHCVISVQEEETEYFQRLLGSSCMVVTVGHFINGSCPPLASVSVPRLGYIGTDWWVNVQGLKWFLREVWPLICEKLPTVELCVAGPICRSIQSAPGIRLLGKVPELGDFYQECPVVINPVWSGTGLKTKTVEAFMHGRPVVTTSVGIHGLASFRGCGLFVCDSPADFAHEAVRLLSDLSLARRCGEDALRCVNDYMASNKQTLSEVLKISPAAK